MQDATTTPASGERRVSFAGDVDRDAAVAQAADALRRDGVVVLDDLIDPAMVEKCRTEIERDYPNFDRPDPTRNFGLYPGRFTVPLRVEHSLGDRAIFCPRAVLDIMNHVLGKACVVDSLGLLVSLPGATDQQRHFDAILFPDTPLDRLLPPVTVAFALPLVRMDAVSGSTGFWPRSHLDPKRVDGGPAIAPVVPVGSALLWDFRVHHCGLANRGTEPRPVVFTVFCRDWWSEVVQIGATHFEKLTIASSVQDGFGDRMRHVTRRARIVGRP